MQKFFKIFCKKISRGRIAERIAGEIRTKTERRGRSDGRGRSVSVNTTYPGEWWGDFFGG